MTDAPSCPYDSVGVITAMGLITFRPNLCLKTCCLLLLITHKCWKKIEIHGGTIFLLCFGICMCMRERKIDAGIFTICDIFKLQVPNCSFSAFLYFLDCLHRGPNCGCTPQNKCLTAKNFSSCVFTVYFKMLLRLLYSL